ncbi:MAG: type IV toxin-antitoxin system AbiEi family antitoxin domain-containing protein [Chloroflexota bacterium]
MSQTVTGLDPKEARFLITFASEGKKVFTVEQARAFWGDAAYTSNVLGRLERGGWLHRVERGTYLLVPLEAGPERAWSESALVLAPYLIEPAAVAYGSALHYWHMTEQVPHTVFVQSTSRKHERRKEILGMPYRFVTVVESKFFGVVERTLDGQSIYVTDREKTLMDAADRPDLCGGVSQLARALRAAWKDLDWPRLDDYLERWPTGSPRKRISCLVESLDLPVPGRKERLARWQGALSSGIVALEPGRNGGEGRIVTRWRLRVNVDETWRRREDPLMVRHPRELNEDVEGNSHAGAMAEEEELIAELELLGVRYLSRQASYQAQEVRSPERLLVDLVRQPHARVRTAVIALLLAHPQYAEAVPAALDRLPQQDRLTLGSLYTAAVFLQREHADRLRPLVGDPWRWLPDLLCEELGLPAVGSPREKLRLLDREMRYRTGATVNWMGSYEAAAKKFMRDRERETAWSR